jgi:hypothetical protein
MDEPEATVYMLQTVQVEMRAQRGTNERRNIIHYFYSGARPTAGELSSLCDFVESNIIEEYEDFVCFGTRWYEIVATDFADLGGATFTKSVNRLSAGGSQVAPGNVSLCITKHCNRRGRSFRGRFFVMDCPEDMFNGDDLNPGYIPVINDMTAKMLLSAVGGRFTPSVGSRKLGGSTPISSYTYDTIADSQRRRLQGRGI